MAGVYRNFEALEGTTSGAETLTLKRKSRTLVIMNDHASNDLSYKFNASEDYGTLAATETVSLYFVTDKVFLSGTSVPYRVWVYG